MTIRVHAPAVSHNGKEKDGAIVWTMLLADLAGGKSLEAKGEFKGGESTKKEEPKEEEPKEEEPEDSSDETVSSEDAPKAAAESSNNNLLVVSIFVLAAVLLVGIIALSRKKS
jgi:hypothetical protein